MTCPLPETTQASPATLRDICNAFIDAKRTALEAGELATPTFADYCRACRQLVARIDPDRPAASIGPADFRQYAEYLSRTFGARSRGREVNMVRGIFRHAYRSAMIREPANFGPELVVPAARLRRKARLEAERRRGKPLFTAEEIMAMLEMATPPMRAMILLAINGGMGNTDCSRLTTSAVDLEAGWLDYPRPKTAVERRVPLWPETVEALAEAIRTRPAPLDPADADLVFLTPFGRRLVRHQVHDADGGKDNDFVIRQNCADEVARPFGRMLDRLGIRRPRIGFYALRHTFETIAGASKDQVAVNAIMGHSDNSMSAQYREGIDDERLVAVTEHVRAWLFAANAAALPPTAGNADRTATEKQLAEVARRAMTLASIDAAESDDENAPIVAIAPDRPAMAVGKALPTLDDLDTTPGATAADVRLACLKGVLALAAAGVDPNLNTQDAIIEAAAGFADFVVSGRIEANRPARHAG